MSIKPWQERQLNYALDRPREVAMQDEIGELRTALQERDAEIVKLMDVNRTLVAKANRQNIHDARQAETIAAQRKVLEQVLFTLVDIDQNSDYWYVEKDITAIQEVLS